MSDLLASEERRKIPKGFHFLLEYEEELDWLLKLQVDKTKAQLAKAHRYREADQVLIVVESLKAAEMRQGCTDYTPYAKTLLRQILALKDKHTAPSVPRIMKDGTPPHPERREK